MKPKLVEPAGLIDPASSKEAVVEMAPRKPSPARAPKSVGAQAAPEPEKRWTVDEWFHRKSYHCTFILPTGRVCPFGTLDEDKIREHVALRHGL